jgi:hypothetical protein
MHLSGQKEGRIPLDHSYVLDPHEFVWDEMLTAALPAGHTSSMSNQLLPEVRQNDCHDSRNRGVSSICQHSVAMRTGESDHAEGDVSGC